MLKQKAKSLEIVSLTSLLVTNLETEWIMSSDTKDVFNQNSKPEIYHKTRTCESFETIPLDLNLY